jgi:bifunctional DNA-binding transcriptional regulator/antitoxin component of YhaV-PrlF toxin-antitoxin module
MSKKEFIVRIGEDGRVLIPTELQKAFQISVGDFAIVEGELNYIKVIPAKVVPRVPRSSQ